MGVQDIYEAMIAYDEERASELVEAELSAGTEPTHILDKGMVAAMDEVGRQFSEGVLFVPEVLMAADAMKAGMEVLRPILAKAGAQPEGTVVIGTVKGDLHDIGKNLVGMMLEGAGFRIVDLGTDVDAETFITTAEEKDAKLHRYVRSLDHLDVGDGKGGGGRGRGQQDPQHQRQGDDRRSPGEQRVRREDRCQRLRRGRSRRRRARTPVR